MTKRKIFFLATDAVLLCVCIFQAILSSKSTEKVFTVKEDIDEIVITNCGETFSTVLKYDNWYVGDKAYPASKTSAESLVSAISSIKGLDKVGVANNENLLQRYELIPEREITVVAKHGNKILRTLHLGKEASAGSQCYATIDDSKDIWILSGNVRSSFDKVVSNIRSNSVLDLEKPLITGVTISVAGEEPWMISRSVSGMETVCDIPGYDFEIDNQKANEFVDSFCALTTHEWLESNEDLGGELKSVVLINYDSKSINLEIYEIPPEDENGIYTYYGKCSETPYTFRIGNYAVGKYISKPEELAK